jgi:filamentous hemagglutinin
MVCNGYQTPEGGWSEYELHPIVPREFGGSNDFSNIVPVKINIHQNQFNPW